MSFVMNVVFVVQLLGFAENGDTEEGNLAYTEGYLEEALALYTQAQVENPDSRELHYNIGNVQYRKEDLDKAIEGYGAALGGSPEISKLAHFNIGNVYYQRQAWEEAVKSFSEVLRLDPDDIEARQNLELALRMLEKNSKEKSDDGDSEEKKEDDQGEPKNSDSKEEQNSEHASEEKQDRSSSPSENDDGSGQKTNQTMDMTQGQAEQILQMLEQIERVQQAEQLEKQKINARGKGKYW